MRSFTALALLIAPLCVNAAAFRGLPDEQAKAHTGETSEMITVPKAKLDKIKDLLESGLKGLSELERKPSPAPPPPSAVCKLTTGTVLCVLVSDGCSCNNCDSWQKCHATKVAFVDESEVDQALTCTAGTTPSADDLCS